MPSPDAHTPRLAFCTKWSLLLWLLLLALATALQCHNGAYSSEFAGHPDEAAHVVTSLMIRDYLVDGLPAMQSPISFAKDYYDHFPKVALGHYPPAFYMAASVPLAIHRSPEAILFFMATLQATAAWLVWFAGRRFLRPASAMLAAFAFILLPLSQEYTAIVMSDMLLVIGVLLAALAFARFLERLELKWSLAFGFCAAITILTKGSGLLLALLPPFGLLLSGKLALIRNYRLWLGALPVLLFAAPWTIATRKISAEGWVFDSSASYFKAAIPYYSSIAPQVLGWTAIVLSLSGLTMLLARWFKGDRPAAVPACIWSSGLSVIALYLLIPSGIEQRYLLPLLPAVLLGMAASGEWLGRQLAGRVAEGTPSLRVSHQAAAIGGSLCLLITLATHHRTEVKECHGMAAALAAMAADSATSPGETQSLKILISSDARGEGALTAAAAFDPAHPWMIIRGSKALSTSNWLGRGYKLKFASPAELIEFLQKEEIAWIIIDDSTPERKKTDHHRQLIAVAKKFPTLFNPGPAASFSRSLGQSGSLRILSVQPTP